MTCFDPDCLEVLLETGSLRILNKPSGLSALKDNVANQSVAELYPDAFGEPPLFVHRIDKGTSGCLLIARTDSARGFLAKAFSKGDIQKKYLALVHGAPPSAQGSINKPLEKARKGAFRISPEGHGLPSLTEYSLLWKTAGKSLLLITPRSGRTHQIRVHLASIGCPLFKDPLYGLQRAKPSLQPEITLHAWKISVPDPDAPESTLITQAPLPSWVNP